MDDMRSFIAIELPEPIRDELAKVQEELPRDGIKLVGKENLHLTLKFLGEIDGKKVEEVRGVLKTVSFDPFLINVHGIGVFPNERHVQVIWAGAKGKELELLADNVNNALARECGQEPFKGHITIARVKRKLDLQSFLEKYAHTDFGAFECTDFMLKESVLTASGPHYSKIASFNAK